MRRWSIVSASLLGLASFVPLTPPVGALPVEPDVPPAACTLVDTVTGVASGLQETVESTTGQELPLELGPVLEDAIADAGCSAERKSRGPGSELCVLLSAASALAASMEETVEGATGTSLPVSPEATARDVSTDAGCSPSGALPAGGDPVCAVLATVRGTARSIQAVVESTSGQTLPVQLASVVGEVEAASGCDAAGGGPTRAACDLISTVAGAGSTVQATVESTSGQALPVSLAATIEDIATERGCVTAQSAAPDDTSGSSSETTTTVASTTSAQPLLSATGGSGSGNPTTAVLGASAERDLPRTGPMAPARALAAGLGTASLLALALARRFRARGAEL
jgi:hypothetical protein